MPISAGTNVGSYRNQITTHVDIYICAPQRYFSTSEFFVLIHSEFQCIPQIFMFKKPTLTICNHCCCCCCCVYLQSRERRTNKCGTLWCFSTASSALEQNNHAAESMSDGLASQVNIYKLFLLWLWWKMIAGTINIFSFIFFGIWVCSD